MDLDVIKWSLSRKILFRFLFCYFCIYLIIPENFYSLSFIDWVAQNVFNLGYPITVLPNGSGDTTYNYIQLFIILISGLFLSFIWSIADYKRDNYEKLNYWFRVILRYFLAFFLMSYGASKVVKTQFSFPDLYELEKKLGDMSPMGLVWTFMGYSKGYNIFTGLGEIIGGTLLFSRRLTTLASIINIAVLSNVFMLNMCYDVPVKIFSFHLLLISIILISDDFIRCFKFFVLNSNIEKVEFLKPFRNKRLNLGSNILKTLFLSFLLYIDISSRFDLSEKWGDNKPKPEMYGIYDVELFKINNKEIQPLLTDNKRWFKLIIDKDFTQLIYMDNDTKKYYDTTVDKSKKTILFKEQYNKLAKSNEFIYKQLPNNYIVLNGNFNNENIEVKLKKKDTTKLNFNRGFNWVNEYPYNR